MYIALYSVYRYTDVPFHMFVFGEIITNKATVKSVSSLEFRLMMMYA